MPPVYVPNPEGSQPKSSTSMIVTLIIGLVCLCLVGIAALAFIGLKYGHARPRPGWRNPLVGVKVKGSWSRYRIPAMGITIFAFKPPVPDTALEGLMSKRYDIREYAGYSFANSNLNVKICGYWRSRFSSAQSAKYGLDYLARQRQQRIQRAFSGFSESKITSTWLDGVESREVSVTFPYKGTSWTCRSEIQMRGNAAFYLEGTYWNGKTAWGRRSFDYIVKSIQFDPPASN